MMITNWKTPVTTLILALLLTACKGNGTTQPQTAAATPQPAANQTQSDPITLPVLNALLADEKFKANLKARLLLTDEQLAALKKISSDEVARLRQSNAATQPASAEAARQNALQAIRGIVGEKTEQMLALARERWDKGASELEAAMKYAELTMLTGPNAVPKDTRIVVNIPAFRMDLFRDGTLLKSFKIGIGYQQYPLPTGFRKAEMIIFNPTWTQPNEPWAASPGEVVAAGAKGNPLGPIKVPIGGANLIHGGKELWKIGTFASHGCVGLTNNQVKDFAKVLAEATNTQLQDETMAFYLKKRTRTQVVKLEELVPVELRYETIVIENGQLHIYRDVYNKRTNTEENLRAVFDANGVSFDALATEEKSRVLEALDALSLHSTRKPPAPATVVNQTREEKAAALAARKAEADRLRKLRSQKEIVIDVNQLVGKGYPGPVNLDSGTGTATTVATTKP